MKDWTSNENDIYVKMFKKRELELHENKTEKITHEEFDFIMSRMSDYGGSVCPNMFGLIELDEDCGHEDYAYSCGMCLFFSYQLSVKDKKPELNNYEAFNKIYKLDK